MLLKRPKLVLKVHGSWLHLLLFRHTIRDPGRILLTYLKDKSGTLNHEEKILTHTLHDRDNDPVIKELIHVGLTNEQDLQGQGNFRSIISEWL